MERIDYDDLVIICKAQAKKIGMLLKEKEWLINHYAKDMVIDNDRLDDHSIDDFKKEIIEDMQQVLKEGGG